MSRTRSRSRHVPGLSPACPRAVPGSVPVLSRDCHDECDRNEKITVGFLRNYHIPTVSLHFLMLNLDYFTQYNIKIARSFMQIGI